MKKTIFILIATTLLNVCGNAQEVTMQTNENNPYDLYAMNDTQPSYTGNLLLLGNFKEKTGVYYAAADAGGAFGWGSAGSALGPAGTAAGIVLGGVCTTAWTWYWENKVVPNPVTSPDDPVVSTFGNEHERCGYLHNKFIKQFINDNQTTFENPSEFMAKIYEPLCKMVASEYGINVNELKRVFPSQALENYVDQYTEISSFTDDNKIFQQMGVIVKSQNNNSQTSEYYVNVLQLLNESSQAPGFNIHNFTANQVQFVDDSAAFSDDEKNTLKGCLNVLRYSYSFWIVNVN